MRHLPTIFVALGLVLPANLTAQQPRPLDIYSIDVEGGQAVLFVSPSGESLLVDAANPGARDADRIVAAAKQAGITQIDYLVVTHFHGDHFGGVPDLAGRLPIRTIVDHGLAMIETSERAVTAFQAYAAVREKSHHLPVKAGDKVPINGLNVQVVMAGGAPIANPLAEGGAANPLCRDFMPQVENEAAAEDGRSVGIVVRFGQFRAIDLGDLTWNKEYGLVCPRNKIGIIDVYFSNRHGIAAGSPTFVNAIKPRIAVFDNGATKGMSREPFLILKNAPGVEDIWQLHYSVPRPARPLFGETTDQGGKDLNAPEQFIANLEEQHTTAYSLKISARQDGSFSVTNQRTGYVKAYKARR